MESLLDIIDGWMNRPRKSVIRELVRRFDKVHLAIHSDNVDEADQSCESVAMFLKSPALSRPGPHFMRITAFGFFDLGSAYRQLRNVHQSEACFSEAIRRLSDLKAYPKHVVVATSQLAACQNQLGLLYLACGPIELAIAPFDDAVRQRRAIASLRPFDAENKVYLGGALCNRGHVAREMGDTMAAMTFYDEAISVLNTALPPCTCGCQDAMDAIVAESTGHPHLYDTLNSFVRNAEQGRLLCNPPS